MPAAPPAPRSSRCGKRSAENSRFFFALLFLLGVEFAGAQSLQTLSVDFVRLSGREEVRGTLYFQAPDRVLIRVSQPALQWSEFEGHNLLIYYPEERRAFRFVSRNRLLIPFARSFLGFLRPDFGLAEAGFSLRQSRQRGDLLLTIWDPPRALRRIIGQALVGTDRGGPVFLQLDDPKGKLLSRTEYGELRQAGGLTFPGRIVVVERSGEEQSREESRYSNHLVNAPLPPEAADFRLPEGIPVQELEW